MVHCKCFQSTYDYGRQLLQATVVLCQSLRCTTRSSGDTLPRLNRVWKQFTVTSDERQHRLEMASAFHTAAEKVGAVLQNKCHSKFKGIIKGKFCHLPTLMFFQPCMNFLIPWYTTGEILMRNMILWIFLPFVFHGK